MDIYEALLDFLSTGGDVLKLILLTTIVLWTLIIERVLYFRSERILLEKKILSNWFERVDHSSWFAHQIRLSEISGYRQKVLAQISLIKTLVSLCPLLGLLGTVTGMISVFDVMALTGTSNARLMASGISMATIPTMAGMIAALSGLYFGSLLETKARRFTKDLSEKLVFQ
jgi:biopolymer transport protein ExbB